MDYSGEEVAVHLVIPVRQRWKHISRKCLKLGELDLGPSDLVPLELFAINSNFYFHVSIYPKIRLASLTCT
jgi:hypothetical protein